jgi:hypothetical protein
MHLWFDAVKVNYIKKEFNQIEKLLQTIHYPTTNRLPRLLRHYKTWKANEFRITLIFGYKYILSVLKHLFHSSLLDSLRK